MYRCATVRRASQHVAVLIIATILSSGTGCSKEPAESSNANQRGRPLATVAKYTSLGVPPSLRSEALGSTLTPPDPQMLAAGGAERMVIKTATVECEVSDCDSTASEIQALVGRKRGYIVSSTLRNQDARQQTGVVVLRVPVKDFEVTLVELKTLAVKMESEDVRGDDVTHEFVDLTARLGNKRKAEQRFLEILRVAKDAPEILEIETSLMGVREEIERLEGRKRYMENQALLCTINFVMHEPAPVTVAQKDGFWSKFGAGIGRGAERGLNGLINTASAAVTLLTMGVPMVLGVILLGWMAAKAYRRIKPRRIADEVAG